MFLLGCLALVQALHWGSQLLVGIGRLREGPWRQGSAGRGRVRKLGHSA